MSSYIHRGFAVLLAEGGPNMKLIIWILLFIVSGFLQYCLLLFASACLVDTKNPTFPLQNVVYEFKKGPVEHIPFFYGYGKFPYPTDNVIYIDRGSDLDEEILDGWCSIEPQYGSSFRGVKLRFEATWQDVSTGEEHSIKNGEALFSNGQIDVNN